MNHLYYGDNLDILKRYIPDQSVDLIYLDPPFQSGRNYNILFKEKNGTASYAQIQAFEDTWHWDETSERIYVDTVENSPKKAADLLMAFRSFLGENDMMAYLVMMAPRLLELRRVLKPTGTIYLHCDTTASHYLKLLMDSIFGIKNFRNEIIWCYRGGGVPKKDFAHRHDIILRYSSSGNYSFNVDAVRIPYSNDSAERLKYKARAFRGDKVYDSYEPHELGKHPEDWWVTQPIMPSSKERLGYPTQKPETLLERIIKASSNEGDTVLDPFCGCGTTITVAQRLNRNWIGIDITHLAISLIRHRLENTFGAEVDYTVVGEPKDLQGARELAKQDRYQFEWWALGLVGARPAEKDRKKGADRGIDGYIYFHDEPQRSSKTKTIIIQVKSGHVGVSHIRELHGVLEREKAQIGVYISLEEPTRPMVTEAAAAGFYHSEYWNKDYPRLQLITIKELLAGKKINCPPPWVMFKQAERYKKNEQLNMDML